VAYPVSFCALSKDCDIAGLNQLPPEISWRLFEALDGTHYRLDFLTEHRDICEFPDWVTKPEPSGIPLFFGNDDLDRLAKDFVREKLGNAMARPTAIFATLLARAVGGRIIVSYADDDGVDSVLICEAGVLKCWAFVGCDEIIEVDESHSVRRAGLPADVPRPLHVLASKSVGEWLAQTPPIYSTFDPEPELGCYVLRNQRQSTVSLAEAREIARNKRNGNSLRIHKLMQKKEGAIPSREAWLHVLVKKTGNYHEGWAYEAIEAFTVKPSLGKMKNMIERIRESWRH
jgi:hypothetical protein